jgi:large subunit ribosomal protein L13
MKTFTLKKSEIQKNWILIDATDLVLGRLASHVANILRGKTKPTYTPNLDCGDNVIIINADKVCLTGRKRTNRVFHWHTGYPGGIKQRTMEEIFQGKHPERVVQKAVQRMLPKGPLGRAQFGNLYVYKGLEHPHQGQKPQAIDFGALNPKNKKR